MPRSLPLLLIAVSALAPAQTALKPHTLHLANGKRITLSLPAAFDINVAAQGMRRVRFMAESPDHRIFATDMYSLEDNTHGAIYILNGWNPRTHTFSSRTTYLKDLRNPNNVAFYTDPSGQSWLYTTLTDRLLRYKYNPGDNAPTSAPQVLARYPDYGLNYKYGGWHLTRTVAFAPLHGQTRLYVTVGSSCNACLEKEPIRATLSVMDPDGKHQQILAHGLRNAVDMTFVPSIDGGALFATNMGDDHLGDRAPEDTFFEMDSNLHPAAPGSNYGWPTCYFEHGVVHPDPVVSHADLNRSVFPPIGPTPPQFDCTRVPPAYTTFTPHASPLGVAFFDTSSHLLANTFLVALHGAGKPHIGTGYRVVRFTPASRHPQNFLLGFQIQGKVAGKINDKVPGKVTGKINSKAEGEVTGGVQGRVPNIVIGRPCGILQTAPDSFLLTDDVNGVIYSIHPKP
jgi:glucose/arabinose dehydrogenase